MLLIFFYFFLERQDGGHPPPCTHTHHYTHPSLIIQIKSLNSDNYRDQTWNLPLESESESEREGTTKRERVLPMGHNSQVLIMLCYGYLKKNYAWNL